MFDSRFFSLPFLSRLTVCNMFHTWKEGRESFFFGYKRQFVLWIMK